MKTRFLAVWLKYKEIAYMNLKAQIVWRADVIFNMLFTISKILFAYLLWGMIFQQKDVEIGRASCRERVSA